MPRKSHRWKGKPRFERYGREIDFKSGEGMNLDTLFLQGRVDEYTYTRYLREFDRQQRHGVGYKAIAHIVGGKTYFEMSDKKDYFYGGLNFDDWCLYHPIEEVFQAAADRLPLPDYRHMVMREIEKSNDMRWIPHWGWESVVGERWLATGSMTMPPDDSALDESLDDYLKRVENSPEDSL